MFHIAGMSYIKVKLVTRKMCLSTNVLTNFIISHFFNDSNCLLILTNKMNPFYYDGELAHVLINVNGADIPNNLIFKHYGCQGIVIINENSVAIFERLEAEMKLRFDRFNNRKYLFSPAPRQRNEILDVFKSPAIKYVADVLALKLNATNYSDIYGNEDCVFDLYTNRYIGSGKESEDVIWLDRWYSANESFVLNADLYPDKLRNQSGRPFKIVTFTYKPYSIVNPPDGTDLLIALEYAKKHNMTPEYIVDEEGQWGKVFDNWTGFGVYGNLAKDMGDVGLGALYLWEERYHFFDYSEPVMRSGVTCIGRAPRLASNLIMPFLSFSKEMWLMTATAYVLISSSLFLALTLVATSKNRNASNSERLATSFLTSEGILLMQASRNIPNQGQIKIIFGLALILSLFLTTAYSGGFASIMAIPRYYGTIRDVNDFVAANLNWGATSTAWISSLDTKTEVFKKLVDSFVVKNEEDLAQMNGDENFAYAIERLQAGNFAIGSYVTLEGAQRRRIMDEDIYWNYGILMVRKNSILLPSLNNVINAVTESGLVDFWEHQVVIRHMDVNTQKAVKDSSTSTKPTGGLKEQLSLKQVAGVFTIWIVGLLISICVFFGELLTNRQL